ncbi:MAG: tetratricopeptide repeat protein [Pseudomonadota bacterium]
MVDIFQEVEEDLRRERTEKLWRKYGKFVIAVAAIVVLGVAGREGWKSYEETSRIENGTRFANALELVAEGPNRQDAALAALDGIIADGKGGFVALGHFQKAAVYVNAGDPAQAVTELEAIAGNSSLDKVFRDLAVVQIAMNSADASTADTLIARLKPIAVPENVWYYSAREMIAVLEIAAGRIEAAKPLLTELADDSEAPTGLRSRATEILRAIEA